MHLILTNIYDIKEKCYKVNTFLLHVQIGVAWTTNQDDIDSKVL